MGGSGGGCNELAAARRFAGMGAFGEEPKAAATPRPNNCKRLADPAWSRGQSTYYCYIKCKFMHMNLVSVAQAATLWTFLTCVSPEVVTSNNDSCVVQAHMMRPHSIFSLFLLRHQ